MEIIKNKTDEAYKFMKLAPREFNAKIEKLSTLEQCDLVKDLEGIAERAALAAGYAGGRIVGATRAKGVKRANKLCTAIRRAIGFSYPKSDLSF